MGHYNQNITAKMYRIHFYQDLVHRKLHGCFGCILGICGLIDMEVMGGCNAPLQHNHSGEEEVEILEKSKKVETEKQFGDQKSKMVEMEMLLGDNNSKEMETEKLLRGHKQESEKERQLGTLMLMKIEM